MTEKLSGGCQCGAVRYESAGKPLFSIHCYCRQCQRITGAGHGSQFGLKAGEVALSGGLAEFELTADSGNRVTSAFCPKCGSPVLKRSAGYAGLVFFHAATLDDPSQFLPERNVWLSAKQPWDNIDGALLSG